MRSESLQKILKIFFAIQYAVSRYAARPRETAESANKEVRMSNVGKASPPYIPWYAKRPALLSYGLAPVPRLPPVSKGEAKRDASRTMSDVFMNFHLIYDAISKIMVIFVSRMKEEEDSQSEEMPMSTFRPEAKLNYRILVVDDDLAVRTMHTQILINHGYQVDNACDGAVGWRAIQGERYNLVITDNSMPKVTGVELLEKMHIARIDVPAIMVTGTLPEAEFARRPWLAKIVMLEKPVPGDELLSLVDKVLNPTYWRRKVHGS
jgi:CheY-like chemotaxis protein